MNQQPNDRTQQDLDTYTGSQVNIILAAETLFAQASIDSVSMREIATKAKQRNHYAVQYHFGTREKLVEAIFRYRMLQMEEQRKRMLEKAEQEEQLHSARALLEIIFLPQLAIQDADGNHSYANFLCQFLMRQPFKEFGDFGMPTPPHLSRAMKLLRIRLGYLPSTVAQRRLVGACLVFLNILFSHGDSNQNANSAESFAAILDDTLSQIELALCMPMREP